MNDDVHRLPGRTTPTWEVELLISGVAVFAMLQLPGFLDDALFALLPRFDPAWAEPARILYIYLKSVAVILGATFAIHLLLRARWIALVGMHSVYPDGVRWERMRMGPVQREVDRLRNIARDPAVPYIQDVVAIGPYLGLVVPYRPGDDDGALRRNCPEAAAATGDGREIPVLDCLQRLHSVRLDGKPPAGLRYDAGSDPRTDRPALVAMIDLRGLAPGRHELRVARTDADADSGHGAGDGRTDRDAEYVIPFWR